MGSDNDQYKVSKLAEFADAELEKEFFSSYLDQTMKYIKPAILMLGILNMIFIIPDYYLIKNFRNFILIMANRFIFLFLVIIFYMIVKKIKNSDKLSLLISLYELIGTGSFIFILTRYEDPNFFIQAFGLMVIVLGIFLIPNKWAYMIVTSLIASLAFFASSLYYIRDLEPMEYSAGIVYIIIVLALSSHISHRMNYYNRKQYAYGRQLLIKSTTDPLTNVYNRSKFDSELKRWIEYSKRYSTPLTVVIFDFDNFKAINDSYGHLTGDKVIVGTINLVKQHIRATDILARWGGEEFVLLLPNTDRNRAMELTERLRCLIAENIFDTAGKITCSFGLAAFRENDDEESLIGLADSLLYRAKAQGKNSVVGL